uniref:Uncharacterized protein n=1 Tax=viral metagenome TaxID=1070528 RepID=A0A6M3LL78_9ZZZZ
MNSIEKITVKSWKSFHYRELHEIVAWKDECIWKTKVLGYIKAEDEAKLNKDKYVCSSVSTHLTRNPEFEIQLVQLDELGKEKQNDQQT